ncbi:MAG: hypothetical protein J7L45_02675 [Candidatus Aenigmarchaeota archaeon]|nr:hypothetical protein [Candidatus Aenigmarchaeota archaeon]
MSEIYVSPNEMIQRLYEELFSEEFEITWDDYIRIIKKDHNVIDGQILNISKKEDKISINLLKRGEKYKKKIKGFLDKNKIEYEEKSMPEPYAISYEIPTGKVEITLLGDPEELKNYLDEFNYRELRP